MPIIPPKDITKTQFEDALNQYAATFARISAKSKSASHFRELDKFRYIEGPQRLSKRIQIAAFKLEDVIKLVEWKLNHGKFRPSLMKLVSSNAPSTVHDVTARAFESWNANDSDFKASIKILTELKGIGPATASLILSVYDPDNAIFFSDECFGWLVGTDKTIKYNMAEYQTLFENSHEIMGRLNVTAMQIEQVAYVIMRESVKSSQSTKLAGTSGQSKKKADAADTDSNTADTSSDPPHLATQTAKRKTLNDDAQIEGAEDQGRRKALRSSTRNTSSHRDNPLN